MLGRLIITFIFSLFVLQSFSQKVSRQNDSLFVNGIKISNPEYTFKWEFLLSDIPSDKLQNFKLKKRSKRNLEIRFDSALFFNNLIFENVIIKCQYRKSDNLYIIKEFIGMVDLITVEKLSPYFDVKYLGWVSYPKEEPLYRFRLDKNKSLGTIVIDRAKDYNLIF